MRFLLFALGALSAFAQPYTWDIDGAHSAVHFAVRHMMVSTVRGDFGKMSGKLIFDPKNPAANSSAEVTVDVASLNTREPKRDAHLKSADFFDAAKYPLITFKSKKVEAVAGGKLKLTGDLTMHGVTREVAFDVEGPGPEVKNPQGGARTGATATATINRKDFGVSWNRALDTGGVAVSDQVSVIIDVELARR